MCRYDVRAWLVWALAGALVATVARNPWYTLIVLLASRVVGRECVPRGKTFGYSFWRFALVVLTLSAVMNALFVHLGATILLELPSSWPLIGGAVTLEAVMMGLVNGLAILALLSVFMTLNGAVPVSDLVRLTPRAFHDLGVVLLVSLTYVPETARHLSRIRDAQAIRGHRLKGVRDWRPIVVPLLVGGLERAMTLAEVMVARGYGSTVGRNHGRLRRYMLIAGLLLALAGWGATLWVGRPGWIMLACSAGLLLIVVRQAGRETASTVYRPRTWSRADTGLLLASLLPVFMVMMWPMIQSDATLGFVPYPRLSLPPFQPVFGLSVFLLCYPILGRRLLPR